MKKLAPAAWNRKTAAHLLVRAGFGATPEQVNAAAGRPLHEAVDGLFASMDEPAPRPIRTTEKHKGQNHKRISFTKWGYV